MKIFRIASTKLNLHIKADLEANPLAIQQANDQKTTANRTQTVELITQAIRHVYNRFDQQGFENFAKRYTLTLTEIQEEAAYTKFELGVSPLDKGKGTDELMDPNDPMYDLYLKHGKGKTGTVVYKTPQEAVQSIPKESNLAYRGMSWGEWQNINKSGTIKSKESYNLGQEGLTFFSTRPEVAANYSAGFSPIQYQVTLKTPGVVIAVPNDPNDPNDPMLTHDDREDIPEGELALLGSMPASSIVHTWFLVATSARKGNLDIIVPWTVDKTHKSDKSNWSYFLNPNQAREGSRSSPIVRYSIVQKF